MIRAVIGAVCGIVLGVGLAVPAFSLAVFAERASLRLPPDAGPDQSEVRFVYHSQLLHLAVTAGGFGGVIGGIIGATSAVVRAIQPRHGPPPT